MAYLFGEDYVEGMDESGEEEDKCEDKVDDDIRVASVLLQEHRERRDEDCQNDQKELLIVRHYFVVSSLQRCLQQLNQKWDEKGRTMDSVK